MYSEAVASILKNFETTKTIFAPILNIIAGINYLHFSDTAICMSSFLIYGVESVKK